MKALLAFFQLFGKGKELSNAAIWKNAQYAANAITAFLVSLFGFASACGYSIPIDNETIDQLGTGLVASYSIANAIITVVTNQHCGFRCRDPTEVETKAKYHSNPQ